MKVLITGSKGMLAQAVIHKFEKGNELICTDADTLDITNEEKTLQFVTDAKPEYIINCAAYTAVDRAEEIEQKEIAEKVNAIGPKNLAMAANQVHAVLIHISTDYVFDGKKDVSEMYVEEEQTAPETIYGYTKEKGETYVQKNCEKYYIFRTAWLYGDGNNFVNTMRKLGKEKEEVKVVGDQYGSPTYTEDLADIIKQAVLKKIPYGIYHATNLGFTTWYDFTKQIFELSRIDCKVSKVTSEEFIRPAKRPKNSKLSKEKLRKQGILIPEYLDGLKRFLKNLGEEK